LKKISIKISAFVFCCRGINYSLISRFVRSGRSSGQRGRGDENGENRGNDGRVRSERSVRMEGRGERRKRSSRGWRGFGVCRGRRGGVPGFRKRPRHAGNRRKTMPDIHINTTKSKIFKERTLSSPRTPDRGAGFPAASILSGTRTPASSAFRGAPDSDSVRVAFYGSPAGNSGPGTFPSGREPLAGVVFSIRHVRGNGSRVGTIIGGVEAGDVGERSRRSESFGDFDGRAAAFRIGV
jgi:hypothetical protein